MNRWGKIVSQSSLICTILYCLARSSKSSRYHIPTLVTGSCRLMWSTFRSDEPVGQDRFPELIDLHNIVLLGEVVKEFAIPYPDLGDRIVQADVEYVLPSQHGAQGHLHHKRRFPGAGMRQHGAETSRGDDIFLFISHELQ